jgi:hypothetical protein
LCQKIFLSWTQRRSACLDHCGWMWLNLPLLGARAPRPRRRICPSCRRQRPYTTMISWRALPLAWKVLAQGSASVSFVNYAPLLTEVSAYTGIVLIVGIQSRSGIVGGRLTVPAKRIYGQRDVDEVRDNGDADEE